MQLNDKCKELAENWIEWGNCYSEINKELDSGKPNIFRITECFEKKQHLDNKRKTLLNELQTLLSKTSQDIQLKLEKFIGK